MKKNVLKIFLLFTTLIGFAATNYAALTLDDDITWNIIGLDSNKVADGPNLFPSGVRVCNIGATTETNVTATFVWDSANSLVNLSSSNTFTVDEILSGECHDFYFQVEVTRDSAAYDTTREFHIEVTSDAGITYSTPLGHELYVEHLISQNRNDNIDIVLDSDPTADPVTVFVGETLTFTGTATTATNGYEQIESYFGFNPDIFRILDIQTTYGTGDIQDTLYSDACTWDEDPASPTYKECIATGKDGGDVTVLYTVEIIAAGSGILGGVVYDFSGSSYHYNTDFGDPLESLVYTAAYKSNLSITKTDNLTTASAGETITYNIVVSNAGPSPAMDAVITDTFPAELENITWTCATTDLNSSCDVTSGSGDINTTADIASGESVTYTITADVIAVPTQDLSNTAMVASPAGYYPEDDLTDNSATDTTDIPIADLAITKDDGNLTYTPGDTFTYTITVSNSGPDGVTGALVEDLFSTISGGFTNVSWTCTTTDSSCITGDAIGTEITTAQTTDISQLVDISNGGTVVFTVTGTFSANMAAY